jgi:hypothetical protein
MILTTLVSTRGSHVPLQLTAHVGDALTSWESHDDMDRPTLLPSSLLCWWCNKREHVKARNKHNKLVQFHSFSFLDLLISHYFFFKWSLLLLPKVEKSVRKGSVQWYFDFCFLKSNINVNSKGTLTIKSIWK